MHQRIRYIILLVGVVLVLHTILSYSNETYGQAVSVSNVREKLIGPVNGKPSPPQAVSGPPWKSQPVSKEYYKTGPLLRRANAVMVLLARNGDLNGIMVSMRAHEARFNSKFNYPYVFLNEVPFTENFKKQVTALTNAKVEFGLIPRDHWYQPSSINETQATESRHKMEEAQVIYGGSVPYRNMCRFNSGFFFKHPLLAKYRYYWRIEPDVKFFCDLDYDPFLQMMDGKKKYGFTIALPEYQLTIPTLWATVKEFIRLNPTLIADDNAMKFLSDDGGETYNGCHFWSNFEIADLDLWRSPAYNAFFDFLDSKGGFYYERWGDAPVHSIGAALFAKKDEIHFFNDIGYFHGPFTHCPTGAAHTRGKCECDIEENFDYQGWSCLKKYDALWT